MMNINKMGLREYLLHHMWWSFIGIAWSDIVFNSYFGINALIVFNLLFISLEATNYFITREKRRNYVSIIASALMPAEMCAVCLYAGVRSVSLWICMGVAGFLSMFFGYILLSQPIRRQSEKRAIIARRIKCVMMNTRNIAAFCLLFFVGFCIFHTLSNAKPVAESTVQAIENNTDAEKWTVKNNTETVKLLKDEEWQKLDVDKKLDVLATVVNIENNYLLGGVHPLYIQSIKLEEDLLGTYCESDYIVTISADQLNNGAAEECLNTVLHECYHAYQYMQLEIYQMVPDEYKNMLMLYDASLYKDELGTISSKDYETYITSQTEIKARKYAEAGVLSYYKLIEKYTDEEGE